MGDTSPFDGLLHGDVLLKMIAHQGLGLLRDLVGPVIENAHATDPAGMGSLDDIEHIVLLMQENRSFDHYFGSLSGVRGFDDPSPAFRQAGYQPGVGATPDGYLNPFRLKPGTARPWTGRRSTTRSTSGPRSTGRGTAVRWTSG